MILISSELSNDQKGSGANKINYENELKSKILQIT